jgi:hypothetical protein
MRKLIRRVTPFGAYFRPLARLPLHLQCALVWVLSTVEFVSLELRGELLLLFGQSGLFPGPSRLHGPNRMPSADTEKPLSFRSDCVSVSPSCGPDYENGPRSSEAGVTRTRSSIG